MGPSGKFHIKSVFVKGGGDLAQGKSVGPSPRPIIAIPEGGRTGIFTITGVHGSRDQRVTITSEPGGAQVVEADGLVYGFVTPAPKQQWRTVRQPQAGPHIYSIERADEQQFGWLFKDDRPDTQISIGPLPTNRANPREPQVLLPGLFRITPASGRY